MHFKNYETTQERTFLKNGDIKSLVQHMPIDSINTTCISIKYLINVALSFGNLFRLSICWTRTTQTKFLLS